MMEWADLAARISPRVGSGYPALSRDFTSVPTLGYGHSVFTPLQPQFKLFMHNNNNILSMKIVNHKKKMKKLEKNETEL